jgi:hypothetical protein
VNQQIERFAITHHRGPGISVKHAVIPVDQITGMYLIEIWKKLKLYSVVLQKKLNKD